MASQSLRLFRILKSLQLELKNRTFDSLQQILKGHMSLESTEDWKVTIQITSDSITVQHFGGAKDPSINMTLDWQVTMKFTRGFTKLDSKLQVLDWQFTTEPSSEVRQSVKFALDQLVDKTYYYAKVLEKDMDDNDFSKLAGLVKNIRVHHDQELVFDRQDNVYDFLECIISRLDSAYFMDLLKKAHGDFQSTNPDLKADIAKFFKKKAMAHTSTLTMIKCLSRHILTPAILSLRNQLFEALPYSTKPHQAVEINISKNQIVVTHDRMEKSQYTTNSYDFTWRLSLFLPTDMSCLTDVTISIVDWNSIPVCHPFTHHLLIIPGYQTTS